MTASAHATTPATTNVSMTATPSPFYPSYVTLQVAATLGGTRAVAAGRILADDETLQHVLSDCDVEVALELIGEASEKNIGARRAIERLHPYRRQLQVHLLEYKVRSMTDELDATRALLGELRPDTDAD